jgi:membrane protease YdiL (CAAX protease family)
MSPSSSRSRFLVNTVTAILIGTILKRSAGILRPTLQSIRFFDASGFYHEFFDRFGPKDFMGIALHGAWWILVYYAVVILVCNIGGEELWWRGYVLPRQELAFGRATWVPRDSLVALPLIHAAYSLGYSPHGNHRYRTLFCCAKNEKHMAGHRWPQLWKPGVLPKPG